ncbi:MAG: hypothetical protein ACXWVQ_05300 [Methyloceanibacter sp.]
MVAGTVLSELVHPWFYALAGADLATRGLLGCRRARSASRSG